MDIFLNPNVAYLILLAGVVLAFFSASTPGTGVGELTSLFCFVLAGYAAYNLSIHWWALVLLAASVPPFILAVRNPKKSLLYLGGCILFLVTGSVFLFAPEGRLISVNPFLAVFASGLVSVVMWYVLRKFIEVTSSRPAHDLDALIGEVGTAASAIHKEGSVQVRGELWSARSNVNIPEGSAVRVAAREGFILIVEKIHPTK
jgi:membrane-bound serine protease (ClpP class)